MADDSEHVAIERRLERAIAGAGLGAALGAVLGWGLRAGLGTAAGAGLCWLNFHWLRQGAAGVIRIGMAQAGAEKVDVPRSTHAKFLGRLALLLLAVYAILAWLKLPAVAVLCGLGVVFPAVLFELGYEVTRGHHRWNA
jgi:ATP synthase I chain